MHAQHEQHSTNVSLYRSNSRAASPHCSYAHTRSVSDAAATALKDPKIHDYFTRLVQRTSPKSYKQAQGG